MCERFSCQVVEKTREILCVFPSILKPHGGKISAQTLHKLMEESRKIKNAPSPIGLRANKTCPWFHLNLPRFFRGTLCSCNGEDRRGISSPRRKKVPSRGFSQGLAPSVPSLGSKTRYCSFLNAFTLLSLYHLLFFLSRHSFFFHKNTKKTLRFDCNVIKLRK